MFKITYNYGPLCRETSRFVNLRGKLFYYIFANVLYVIFLVGGNWVVRRGTIYNYGPLCRKTSRFVNLREKLFYYIFANVLYVIFLVGENWLARRGTIGLFPGSTNFCQCFIGYLPCGWQLGCSAGNNKCCSAGNNRVVSRQRKFWQNISIILLSHD